MPILLHVTGDVLRREQNKETGKENAAESSEEIAAETSEEILPDSNTWN
jgi:hypothetical protein